VGQAAELPYEARGRGEPVLLIQGTGFGSGMWGELGDLLSARRRVIAYDRRGFTAVAAQYPKDMRVNADDAESVLRRAEAAPADVIGWSGGGLVALALAVEHPSLCRSLLLIEPSVYGLRAVTFSALAMTLRASAAKLLQDQRAATDLAYRWTFAHRGQDRSGWDEMPGDWRDGVLEYAHNVAAEQAHETSLRYPPKSAMQSLDLPVTVVLGELSQGYFHRIGRRLERLLPSCRVVVAPKASHGVHLDAPSAVAGLMR
jgi:pimeloyl-ACP methyl ester carboxylesterase